MHLVIDMSYSWIIGWCSMFHRSKRLEGCRHNMFSLTVKHHLNDIRLIDKLLFNAK